MSDRVCSSCVPGVLCTGLCIQSGVSLTTVPVRTVSSERSTLPTPSTEQPLTCSVSLYSGPFWTFYINGVIESVCVRAQHCLPGSHVCRSLPSYIPFRIPWMHHFCSPSHPLVLLGYSSNPAAGVCVELLCERVLAPSAVQLRAGALCPRAPCVALSQAPPRSQRLRV